MQDQRPRLSVAQADSALDDKSPGAPVSVDDYREPLVLWNADHTPGMLLVEDTKVRTIEQDADAAKAAIGRDMHEASEIAELNRIDVSRYLLKGQELLTLSAPIVKNPPKSKANRRSGIAELLAGGDSTRFELTKGVTDTQIEQFLANVRLSQVLDPILIKLWNLVKYEGPPQYRNLGESSSYVGGSRASRNQKANFVDLPLALYLRLIISLQLALFVVDDLHLYHPKQLRFYFYVSNESLTLQKKWDRMMRAISKKSNAVVSFRQFRHDAIRLLHESMIGHDDAYNM